LHGTVSMHEECISANMISLSKKEGSFKKSNKRFDSLLDFYEEEKRGKKMRIINLVQKLLAVKG